MATAMILSAGRGERMQPLTDTIPKPLLEVAGKPLIVWQIEKLSMAGYRCIVINVAHLGDLIMKRLGDGSEWGVQIRYSDEREEGALESLGGIVKALPLIEDDVFMVVNADVWCDYPYTFPFDLKEKAVHLILVPNPDHNPEGDFGLNDTAVVSDADHCYTFAGIGYYRRRAFEKLACGKAALAPWLREKIGQDLVSGELYNGVWIDVGTPKRLQALNGQMKQKECNR